MKENEVDRFLSTSIFSKKTGIYIVTLIVTFFVCIADVLSQDVSKYYASSQQSGGTLYFVYPQKGFESIDSKNELTFDLTYLTSNDSVVLNFTYIDSRVLHPDSLQIITPNSSFPISSPVSQIYVETSKSKWIYRYGAKFRFSELNEVVNSLSPELWFYCKDEVIKLRIKDGKWKKQSGILSRIFEIIRLNIDK